MYVRRHKHKDVVSATRMEGAQLNSQFQNVVSQLKIMSTHEVSVPGASALIDGDGTDDVAGDRLDIAGAGSGS